MLSLLRKIERLSLLGLSISVLCHTLTVYLFYRLGIAGYVEENVFHPGLFLLIFIVLPLACSLIIHITRHPISFYVVLTARMVLALVLSLFLGRYSEFVLIILFTILLETSIYVAFPRNITLGACFIALVFLTGLIGKPERLSAANLLVMNLPGGIVLLIANVMFSLLIYYREILVNVSGQNEKLNGVIADLTRMNIEYQQYASNIEQESTEKERNKITRELHDGLGYIFSNLLMILDASKVHLEKNRVAELRELLESAAEQAEQGLEETRSILHLLRESDQPFPLGVKTIQNMVNTFKKITGIEVQAHFGNVPWSFGKLIDKTVYRLVQEGLINSFKHGKATKVSLRCWQTDSEIIIHIRDNGRGASHITEGLGLLGMRERLGEIGGNIEAGNVEGGFELSVNIPFSKSISYG